MKYFRLNHSSDTKEIGAKFPQVKDGKGDFKVQSSNYIGNSLFYLKKIDINPILPELVLSDSSKVTDLISSSFLGTGSGLICSNKLKQLIEGVRPEQLQFFTIKLNHKSKVYEDYWFLHPTKTNNELIDYSKSEIWEERNLLKVKRRDFSDAEAFHKEAKQLKYPYSLHIYSYYLRDELPDFFVLNYIDGGIGFFVSERLKDEIEQAGCTGIVFTKPNERYP